MKIAGIAIFRGSLIDLCVIDVYENPDLQTYLSSK